MLVKSLAVLFILQSVRGASYRDCTLFMNGIPTKPSYFTPEKCVNGEVRWDYPEGEAHVHFRYSDPAKSFRVCIASRYAYMLEAAYDITDNGNTTFTLPKDETERHCTKQYKTETVLQLVASDMLYYVTMLNYTLEFQADSVKPPSPSLPKPTLVWDWFNEITKWFNFH